MCLECTYFKTQHLKFSNLFYAPYVIWFQQLREVRRVDNIPNLQMRKLRFRKVSPRTPWLLLQPSPSHMNSHLSPPLVYSWRFLIPARIVMRSSSWKMDPGAQWNPRRRHLRFAPRQGMGWMVSDPLSPSWAKSCMASSLRRSLLTNHRPPV